MLTEALQADIDRELGVRSETIMDNMLKCEQVIEGFDMEAKYIKVSYLCAFTC